MAGASAIDATMTPNDDLHLCESISKQRTQIHARAAPPPSPTTHKRHPAPRFPKRRLQEGNGAVSAVADQ